MVLGLSVLSALPSKYDDDRGIPENPPVMVFAIDFLYQGAVKTAPLGGRIGISLAT